ncbi:MAG: MauE/DoxX family redox-associated membrane protein [bacterium]
MQQNLLHSRVMAAYAVRLLVAAERCLGLACFQRARFRHFTLPAIFGLLAPFSFYLAYLAFLRKDTGSCHCFGELIRMSPLESLFKNLALFGLVLYLFRKTRGWPAGSWRVPAGLAAASLLIVFLGFPARQIGVHPSVATPSTGKSRFAEFRGFSDGQAADLTTGTCLAVFVSLDCDHCRTLVTSLAEADSQNALPSTYLICLGETSKAPAFFRGTDADFPYLCVGPKTFFAFIGERPPRLYLLQHGQARAFWDNETFDPQQLRPWWSR